MIQLINRPTLNIEPTFGKDYVQLDKLGCGEAAGITLMKELLERGD